MPVKIHGNEYVTVAERVQAAHAAHSGALSITTEVVSDDADGVVVKATVTIQGVPFTGHARSSKSAKSIEGDSPLEVAETSAVGRALGFAGFGIAEGIATADEVSHAVDRRAEQDGSSRSMTENQKAYLFGGGKVTDPLASRWYNKVGGKDGVEALLESGELHPAIVDAIQYKPDGSLSWRGALTMDEASALMDAFKDALGIKSKAKVEAAE